MFELSNLFCNSKQLIFNVLNVIFFSKYRQYFLPINSFQIEKNMCISYDNILVDSKSEFYYITFLALNIIDINNFINSIEFGRFSHKISVLNSILCVNQTLFYNISE